MTARRILTTLFLAVFPVAAWMLRNALLIGKTSALHRTGELFMLDKLSAPVDYYVGLLGIVGLIVVIGAIFAALWQRTRLIASLLLVTLGHLAAVYLPSLVTQMNGLDDRLLFTVTVFAAMTVGMSMERMWHGQSRKKYHQS